MRTRFVFAASAGNRNMSRPAISAMRRRYDAMALIVDCGSLAVQESRQALVILAIIGASGSLRRASRWHRAGSVGERASTGCRVSRRF